MFFFVSMFFIFHGNFIVFKIHTYINVIYINNKTYFELLMNDDTENVYIIQDTNTNNCKSNYKKNCKSNYNYKNNCKNPIYGFEIASEEKLNTIRNTYYKLVTIDKSIKSISSYKVEDLLHICNKLEIDTINKETNKKKSKKELYDSIIQYF